MITFICFVLWKLGAPWWAYVLSILGVICEFDTSSLLHKKDLQDLIDVLEDES